ncbi:hypothetical protein PMAYCL1PPCAC_30119 [Pristionchus mayeri]|uniref:Uncharacterized protein n=1 Tax=Pristionchus mayeri TaxID=1317129 RepID=A0AAN5ICV4_9BILA|nr:hypothetical protein PMAYCL1PPCAC_30119 [Pristionchus mayeri]
MEDRTGKEQISIDWARLRRGSRCSEAATRTSAFGELQPAKCSLRRSEVRRLLEPWRIHCQRGHCIGAGDEQNERQRGSFHCFRCPSSGAVRRSMAMPRRRREGPGER